MFKSLFRDYKVSPFYLEECYQAISQCEIKCARDLAQLEGVGLPVWRQFLLEEDDPRQKTLQPPLRREAAHMLALHTLFDKVGLLLRDSLQEHVEQLALRDQPDPSYLDKLLAKLVEWRVHGLLQQLLEATVRRVQYQQISSY